MARPVDGLKSALPTSPGGYPPAVPWTTRRLLLSTLVILAAVGGGALATPACAAPGGQSAPPTTVVVPGERLPTQGPIGPDPKRRRKVPLDLLGGLVGGTPIFPGDFADPFLLAEPKALFIYATNTTTANVPVTRILVGDAFNGDYLGDALPALPSWTVKGFQWAPSVWARPDGKFVLYYSTPAPSQGFAEPRKQCISRALGSAPEGPFVDDSPGPFICPLDEGGAIDPSPFVDGDTPYLLWKADGNSEGLPTKIYSQQLSPDGLSVAGPPNELITNDQPWEGLVVEGPSMVQVGDTYELFYSANNWDSADYAVGIALCQTVAGPCTKPLDRAWMVSAEKYTGPGGQEFFANPGGVWMVHHGFLPGQAGRQDAQRRLYLDLLKYSDGDPVPRRVGAQYTEWSLLKAAFWVLVVLGLAVGAFVWLRRRRRRAGDPDGRPVTDR